MKQLFVKEIEIDFYDNSYLAEVTGYKVHDVDGIYTEVTKITLTDYNGTQVDKTHPDYYELIEYVMDQDFEIDVEIEGLDKNESIFDCLE